MDTLSSAMGLHNPAFVCGSDSDLMCLSGVTESKCACLVRVDCRIAQNLYPEDSSSHETYSIAVFSQIKITKFVA